MFSTFVLEGLRRRDQCAAVLVCKKWNDTATILIWSSPLHYVPLKALWTLIFESKPKYTEAKALELPENFEKLLTKNWNKLLERARLITSIIIVRPLDAALHGIWRSRLANQGVRFLCPNVVRVHAQDISCTVDTCLLVAGESVRELQLKLNHSDGLEETLSRLRALPQDQFPLERLKIQSTHRYPSGWDALLCATLFPRLLFFHYVGPLFMGSWRTFSIACPRLQVLRLEGNDTKSKSKSKSKSVYPTIDPPAIFPSLQELDVTLCSGHSRFVISLASHMPQLVKVLTGITETPNGIQAHMRMARHFQKYSPPIEALRIRMASVQRSYAVIPDFGSLRKLWITDIEPHLYPVEQDVQFIAEGLPNLVHLVLARTGTSFSSVCGINFKALHIIGRNCSKLETLDVAVDARDLKTCPFQLNGPVFAAMRNLTLRPLTVSDNLENGVAYFIRGMAPKISEFCCDVRVYLATSDWSRTR